MKTEQIKKSFYQIYGKQLEPLILNDDNEQGKADRFIERQRGILITFCKSRNINFDYNRLNEQSKNLFDYILLEQLYWVLNNEDFTLLSGYDVVNNQSVAISDIVSRYVSPNVQIRLSNFGFCYKRKIKKLMDN